MKTTLSLILLFLISFSAFPADETNLPREPWEAIVDMVQRSPNAKWTEDIRIKLFGNYTANDSLMVANAIQQLDSLAESISISFSPYDRGNFEIFFIDSTNEKQYEGIIFVQENQKSSYSYHTSSHRNNNGEPMSKTYPHFNLGVRISQVPQDTRQNFITNNLARSLFRAYWHNKEIQQNNPDYNGPRSIFISLKLSGTDPMLADLIPFDQKLIQTVYRNNFDTLLTQAEEIYKPKGTQQWVSPKWVKNNAFAIAIFPIVVLLFLFAGLVILIYKKWLFKIPYTLIRFNVTSVIALILTGFSISIYPYLAAKLQHPDIYFTSWIEISAGTLATLVIGIIAANIFRLIERFVNQHTTHKYLKTFVLFLSTSLLPSAAIFTLVWISLDHIPPRDQSQSIKVAIYLSLLFTLVGVLRALIHFFTLKEQEIKTANEVKLANLRELKTKAELNALHSKINPHFLYNALNSIAGLSAINAEKTEQMALSLSKLFRYSINMEQNDWTTFADELEMVQIYLNIEKVRFDDRLDYSIEIPEELKSNPVPRFIIQPLVENAIKHGISNRTENGKIKVSINREGNWLEIRVADNGPDFPKELSPGFGLQSIYDKLEILYPNRFEIHFLNAPDKHILIKLATDDQL